MEEGSKRRDESNSRRRYESFWLGPWLFYVWRVVKGISEAHNGYIDVYLNLGAIGALLLVGVSAQFSAAGSDFENNRPLPHGHSA
jgi:O-antigen ligase